MLKWYHKSWMSMTGDLLCNYDQTLRQAVKSVIREQINYPLAVQTWESNFSESVFLL